MIAQASGAEAGRPDVAIIVLAAGLSTRTAPEHKLLRRSATGNSMIGRTIANALATKAARIIIVTGYRAVEIVAAAQVGLADTTRLRFAYAPRHAEGMSASLAAGIAAAPQADAVLICLADMPLVPAAVMDRLIAAFDLAAGATILVPTYAGRRGNPILWSRHFFRELAALTGDSGGRALLGRHAAFCRFIETDSAAILQDFDLPGAEF